MLSNCGAGEDYWTARQSNQSILKEISPGCLLEGQMLKLKSCALATWCKELTHWKRSWCWERMKAGGEGDDRGWDGWMASPTQWTWVWANSRRYSEGQRSLACCSSWSPKESDTTERLNNSNSAVHLNWYNTVNYISIIKRESNKPHQVENNISSYLSS